MSGLKRAALIFVLCIAASIFCAYVMIIVLNFWDPESHESFGRLLADPDFSGGGGIWGAMFGVTSFPFVYLATRKRRLLKVAPITVAIVVAEIILVTPFAGPYTFGSAVLTLAIALVLCGTGRFG